MNNTVLQSLLRIEHARQPLNDRTTLPNVLDCIALEMQACLAVSQVVIWLRDDLFDPPLPLTITVGTSAPAAERGAFDLAWAGVTLGQVQIAPPADADQHPLLPLLLRVVSESIAEVQAAERLVQRTRERLQHDLALDLHDAARNTLAGIGLLADEAERDLDVAPAQARLRLHTLRAAARQAQDRVRFLISHLRGHDLVHDLQATLDAVLAFVAQAAPALQIQTRLTLPQVDGDTAACLVGLVRTALTNVIEHAQAQQVQVTITPDSDDDAVLLQVCDDGIGCDPQVALAAPGVGLESMLAWVQQRGGSVTLQSAPSSGFCLLARLPLEQTARDLENQSTNTQEGGNDGTDIAGGGG
jgi:signal transduction histidine kinase